MGKNKLSFSFTDSLPQNRTNLKKNPVKVIRVFISRFMNLARVGKSCWTMSYEQINENLSILRWTLRKSVKWKTAVRALPPQCVLLNSNHTISSSLWSRKKGERIEHRGRRRRRRRTRKGREEKRGVARKSM